MEGLKVEEFKASQLVLKLGFEPKRYITLGPHFSHYI